MKEPAERKNNTSSTARYGLLTVILVAFGSSLLLWLAQADLSWAVPIIQALAVTGFFIVLIALLLFWGEKFLSRSVYKDDSRKSKPEEILIPPVEPIEAIDSEPTYAVSSDGEMLEVVEDAPPALSFKRNDDDDEQSL